MTGVGWQRWALGLVVAGLIPITVAAGCSGEDVTPEGGAGKPSSSGSATGGSATGGSATGGVATGGVATGGVATGGVATAGSAVGGGSAGSAVGGAPTCCSLGDNSTCLDGHTLQSCLTAPGGSCASPGLYSYVWTVHQCECAVSDGVARCK